MQYRLFFFPLFFIFFISCSSYEEIDPISINTYDFNLDFEINDIFIQDGELVWCGGKTYTSGYIGTLDTAIQITDKGLNCILYSEKYQKWFTVGVDSRFLFNSSIDSFHSKENWILYQLNPYAQIQQIYLERDMEMIATISPRKSYVFEFDEFLNYTVNDYIKEIRTAAYCTDEPLYLGYGFPIDSAGQEYVYPNGDVWVASDSCMIIGYSGVFTNLKESFSAQLSGEFFTDIAANGNKVAVSNAQSEIYISTNSGRNFKKLDLSDQTGSTISLEWGKENTLYVGMSNSRILEILL